MVVGNGTAATNSTGELYVFSNISGPGGLTKDYVSGLIGGRQGESTDWGNSQGILLLGGNNSYEGNTTINSGTVLLASPNALPPTTPLYIDSQNGSTLDLGGQSATVGGLYNGPNGGGTITNSGVSAAALIIGESSASTFGGSLTDGTSGVFGLELAGAGTLCLTGTNLFSGGITVVEGTLILDGARRSSEGIR